MTNFKPFYSLAAVKRYVLLAAPLMAIALALPAASPALAGDNQGNTLIKVLGTYVLPESDLKGASGLTIDVEERAVPTLSIAYFLTNNIAVETICCFTSHSIFNQANGAKISDVWIFPPTLSLQYHQQLGAFKPYVGVGVNYMAIFDESGPGIDLKNDWGLALGGGVDVALGGGWQLSFDVKKIIGIDSDIHAGGAYLDTVELDPWMVSVG
ncbi:MAG: OmpW family protein, partial [Hyphomicrobium sp.]